MAEEDTNPQVEQNVIRSHCIAPFVRSVVLRFTPSPWAVESQVLGHPSSVGYGFYLEQWASSQTSHWLVPTISVVPPLLQHTLKAGHHCKSEGLWLGWHVCFSFGGMQIMSLFQRHQNVGIMSLCRHELDFSMFSDVQAFSSSLQPFCQFVATDRVLGLFPWYPFGQQLNQMLPIPGTGSFIW